MAEPFSIAANAAVAAGAWLKKFLKRSRQKDVDAAAHMLHHAGLLMVELRSLRDAMYDLLHPLTGFRAAEWEPSRRRAWREQARLFDRGPDSINQIRRHARALQELEPPTDKARELRAILVRLGEETTHLDQGTAEPGEVSARARGLSWYQEIEPYRQQGEAEFGATLLRSGPDLLIRQHLPGLIWLVDHADGDSETAALRRVANALLVTRTHDNDEPLDDVVETAVKTFGTLEGHLLARYPEIPGPEWAWTSG